MVTRRRLLVTGGSIGSTVFFAGCSSSGSNEQSPESEGEPSESDTSDGEETKEVLPNFSVGEINFSYGFSSGLSTTVELINETEQGSGVNTANVAVEAYNSDELVGQDDEWQDVQASFTAEYELKIDELSQTADASLDDVTNVRIFGQEENEKRVQLETFSGDTLRSRVGE